MKLSCDVEVSNRLLPSVRRKSQRSCLAIARPTVKTNELYVLLQTQCNKQGVKYKVEKNVEKLFVKFINHGKATIRFLEPPHDLNIRCDAVRLKSFIHVLKLGISKKVDPSVLPLSNVNPKSVTAAPKIKTIIKKDSEYPILQGFPRVTEELYVVGLNKRSFDRNILKLRFLRILNLSGNRISSLPKEMGDLPNLQELILSDNMLGKATSSKWTWLDQSAVTSALRSLDISGNLLTALPRQIRKLAALVNLKISGNMLVHLPQSIGNMSNLKYLDLSKNNITHLPGSMKNLKLLFLDISNNAFDKFEPLPVSKDSTPSLVELAARCLLRTRRMYDASVIPRTLVGYMDDAKYCLCGSACFDCYIRRAMEMDVNSICHSLRSSGDYAVKFDCFFCTPKCFQRYCKVLY